MFAPRNGVLCILLLCATIFVSHGQSPFRYQSTTDVLLLGAGGGALLGGQLLKEGTIPLTADEVAMHRRSSVPGFDRASTWQYSTGHAQASDALLLATMISPAALAMDGRMREDVVLIGTMYAETVLLGLALPAVSKGLSERSRPYVYNEAVPLGEKTKRSSRQSFFSGHTTLAFSSVVFLNYVYGAYYPSSGLRPWLWAAGLTAATGVAVLRVLAGKHFPSDVLVGAAVGSAIGVLVPWLHRANSASWSLHLQPLPGGARAGMSLRM